MKQHQGAIIEAEIIKSGRKKQDIARQLGITRQTLGNKLRTPNLPMDFLFKIGKILQRDFLSEFKYPKTVVAADDEIPYRKLNETADYWKDKYLALLEQYNQSLRDKFDDVAVLLKALKKFGESIETPKR